MKKLLSVVLAVMMVLSSVVFAVPSAVSTNDTAMEEAEMENMAELAANAKLARGINLFTGTKDAFDGDNYSDFSSWLKQGTAGLLEKVAVVDDPTGVRDKVLNLTLPAGCSTGYPNFKIDFGGDLDTDIGHTYVYLAFDYNKYVADTTGFVENKSYWWLNTTAKSGDFAPINHDISANEGWLHFGKVMDLTVNATGTSIYNTVFDPANGKYGYNNEDINKFIYLQFGVNQDNTVDVNVLFDNLVFAPAYKVTYYNMDGSKVVKEEFVVVDEEGNLLSSFTPETLLADGKAYSNWSLAKGGSVVKEVALTDNADINLYATREDDVFGTAKVVLDKKLTKKGDKATATAVFTSDVAFDPAKVTWSVEDENVAIVSYDADKELATVTAKGAGTTNITFTYDGTSFTDTITVADGPVVATGVTSGSAISAFAGLDLDVYEYITFNVTNTSGSAKTVSVDLNGADTGDDIGVNFSSFDVTVPAGVTNYDVYLDLSDEDAWTGNADSIVATFSGITVNNAKLWAELNVENGIGFSYDVNLLTAKDTKANVEVFNSSDLEGVYGEEFDITVDADPAVATYTINGNKIVVTAVAGNGSVIINAVNKADSSVKASKEVLINVIEGKKIGYMWDFDSSTSRKSFGNGWGHHSHSSYTDSSLKVVVTQALINGAATNFTMEEKSGKITLASGGGAISTSAITANAVTPEHKYLVMKMRTNGLANFAATPYMMYEGNSDYIIPSVTHTISGDYALYCYDLSKNFTGNEKYFKTMMFVVSSPTAIATNEVVDGTTINSTFANLSWKGGEMTYVEFDEIYFANYDPTKTSYGVSLKADKTSLDGDGIITLYSEVFADDVIENDDVNYTVDKEGYVSILKNKDGTATVTPLKNGTVTITVSSVMDEEATDSITLTFTNVPTRTVAYDLKLMLIGNSYLEHAYLATADKDLYNGYLSPTDIPRGMAATSPELDYYAQLCKRLEAGFEGTFTSKKQGGAVIEQAWKKGLASGTPSDLTGWDRNASLAAMKLQWKNILDYMDREQPNLITIQLAENAAHAYEESAEFFYRELFTVIDEHRPENSIVVIISPMGTNAASRVQSRIASEYGFYWADNTWIGDENGWGPSNHYLAFDEYPDYTNAHVVEFRTHPGNEGMEEIAKSAYAIFEKYIPTTIPANLVTIPEEIEITGNNTITTAGGTAKLYASVTPASATPVMTWTVDNENLASVDETGLVTAKLNGTVTVTATSAYDETVSDTYTITITGQTPHYTLTYAAGADDTVTGLPESFAYAAGNYEFPELVAPPERNGYKFLGWGENEGGKVVDSVEMTSDKTVYAVWAFADSWNFDKDGDLEGIMVAGFNTKVEDGKMSTISYDGIAVGFSDETLLLNSDLYKTFTANISMSTVNDGDEFVLTIITDAGEEKEFRTATKVGAINYTFKLDGVTGMITGFTLFTTNSADGVGMTVDSAKFVKTALREDKTYESLDVTSKTILEAGNSLVSVENLSVSAGATLKLNAGTYVIENADVAGKIEASENANVIIKSGAKPDGYVEFNIGASAGAKRYAEVNGKQYEISGEEVVYGMITSKKLLVEIISVGGEVSLAADGSDTVTRYFLVDGENGTAQELPLGNYMYNSNERNTIRLADGKTNNDLGLRFAASVDPASKKSTEYTITEYGYIIGLEETINLNGGQLNFELVNERDGRLAYVSGKAYVRGEYDKVFASEDNVHVFTGVLYGAPADQYGKRLVAKTYTKLTVDGENYVVYGQPMTESFYSIAKKLKDQGGLSEEAQTIVDNIIKEAEDFDSDIGLPGDDLWG